MKSKLAYLLAVCFVLMLTLVVRCGKNDDEITPGPPAYEHARGFLKQPTDKGLVQGAPFILADRVGELPYRFNWAIAGFDIPVKNQKNCGSCWAFSSTENFEWALKIFSGKDMLLAPQELVGNMYGGCRGGYWAGSHMKNPGLPLEKDCPYRANNSSCPKGVPYAAQAKDDYNVGEDGKSPTVNQLKAAMMQFGPLTVDVAAGGDWDNVGPNDIISGHNGGINHMVVIYGWDDAKEAWNMRNSWGSGWGDNGSAWVKFGADSIGSDAATVLVKPLATYVPPK